MGVRRGHLVPVAVPGDYGKPRPALVVQSDLFADHASVTLLQVTSFDSAAPLLRVGIAVTETSGLLRNSFVMLDKMQTIRREKVGPPFGQVSLSEMQAVERGLLVFLGLGR